MFSILFITILTLKEYDWENYKFVSLIYVFLIFCESQILQSFCFTLVKILNFKFFFNIYLIMFMEGFLGMFFLIIFDFFYVYIFKKDTTFIFKLGIPKYQHSLLLQIIALMIYCICIFGLNCSYLKITEEISPMYTMVGKGLSEFSIEISHYIQKMINKEEINISQLIEDSFFHFFFILGNCIFCEIITFHCFNLDKNTVKEIRNRGDEDYKTGQIIFPIKKVNHFSTFNFSKRKKFSSIIELINKK